VHDDSDETLSALVMTLSMDSRAREGKLKSEKRARGLESKYAKLMGCGVYALRKIVLASAQVNEIVAVFTKTIFSYSTQRYFPSTNGSKKYLGKVLNVCILSFLHRYHGLFYHLKKIDKKLGSNYRRKGSGLRVGGCWVNSC